MKHIAFCAAVLSAGLAGCSTAETEPAPAASNSAPEAQPVASKPVEEGRCARCNARIYDGHQCGKTVPCRLCEREAGPQHRHALVWNCVPCRRTYRATHVCNDSSACPTCRTAGARRMPPRGCTGCGGIVTALDSKPATSYCETCNLEVGKDHLHGKTRYCAECEREAGANHVHNATRMCADCGHEAAPDHRHGVTAYCVKCGRDQGLEHEHGRTLWCVKCDAEKVDPHSVHTGGR
jgi:hypothetical protein